MARTRELAAQSFSSSDRTKRHAIWAGKMIIVALLAALMTDESTQTAWMDQLREADRLTAENKLAEAETAYIAARKQAEKSSADQLPLAITLEHMGRYYQSLGRLLEAERFYVAAFGIVERTLGGVTEIGIKLALDLSATYLELDKPSKAELVIRRILRKSDELSASDRAIMLAELASVLACKQEFRAAELLFMEALPVFERDPRRVFRERTIITLSNVSTIYMQTGRFAQARIYSDRARALLGTLSDPPIVLVFKTTANAAAVSARTGEADETDFLFQSAIKFCETKLGRDYYLLGPVMNNYALFLRKAGRRADAKMMSRRARALLVRFNRENLTGLTIDASAFR